MPAAQPGPSSARLITAALAIACAGGCAAVPLADPGPLDALVVDLAVLGMAATFVGVVMGWAAWGSAAAALFAGELVATLYQKPAEVDLRLPAFAAGLLVLAELVAWTSETRTAGTLVRARFPRPVVLAAVAFGAWIAGLALSIILALPLGTDLAVAAAGAGGVALAASLILAGLRVRAVRGA